MRSLMVALILVSLCACSKRQTHFVIKHKIDGQMKTAETTHIIPFGETYKQFFSLGKTTCTFHQGDTLVLSCDESTQDDDQSVVSTVFDCSINDSEKHASNFLMSFPKSEFMSLKAWCE